ncbi:MAG: hypothetical protein IT168_28305 [Bryobacterales bacterium]|nr:hypothetical protein [Bryobacterales bacterium]
MIDEDRLLRDLASLPPITPNLEREASVRKRCHAAIAGRKSRGVPTRKVKFRTTLVDIAAATGLFVYLAAMLTEAIRLGGAI